MSDTEINEELIVKTLDFIFRYIFKAEKLPDEDSLCPIIYYVTGKEDIYLENQKKDVVELHKECKKMFLRMHEEQKDKYKKMINQLVKLDIIKVLTCRKTNNKKVNLNPKGAFKFLYSTNFVIRNIRDLMKNSDLQNIEGLEDFYIITLVLLTQFANEIESVVLDLESKHKKQRYSILQHWYSIFSPIFIVYMNRFSKVKERRREVYRSAPLLLNDSIKILFATNIVLQKTIRDLETEEEIDIKNVAVRTEKNLRDVLSSIGIGYNLVNKIITNYVRNWRSRYMVKINGERYILSPINFKSSLISLCKNNLKLLMTKNIAKKVIERLIDESIPIYIRRSKREQEAYIVFTGEEIQNMVVDLIADEYGFDTKNFEIDSCSIKIYNKIDKTLKAIDDFNNIYNKIYEDKESEKSSIYHELIESIRNIIQEFTEFINYYFLCMLSFYLPTDLYIKKFEKGEYSSYFDQLSSMLINLSAGSKTGQKTEKFSEIYQILRNYKKDLFNLLKCWLNKIDLTLDKLLNNLLKVVNSIILSIEGSGNRDISTFEENVNSKKREIYENTRFSEHIKKHRIPYYVFKDFYMLHYKENVDRLEKIKNKLEYLKNICNKEELNSVIKKPLREILFNELYFVFNRLNTNAKFKVSIKHNIEKILEDDKKKKRYKIFIPTVLLITYGYYIAKYFESMTHTGLRERCRKGESGAEYISINKLIENFRKALSAIVFLLETLKSCISVRGF